MKKKTIYAINDLAFILVILSTLMDDFVDIWLGHVFRFAGMILYLVACFAEMRDGGDFKVWGLRALGFCIIVAVAQVSFTTGMTWPLAFLRLAGMVILLYAVKDETRLPVYLIILVTVLPIFGRVIPMLAGLAGPTFSSMEENPFEHRYRLTEVVSDSGMTDESVGQVYLESDQSLYLMLDSETYDETLMGKLEEVKQDTGTMWECVCEDGMTYRLTEEGGGFRLACHENGQQIWAGTLERVDTLVCFVNTVTMSDTPVPDWFIGDTFNGDTKYLSFGEIKTKGTMGFTWREDPPEEMTVVEEYYSDEGVEIQEYKLQPNENGGFSMDLETRGTGKDQYAIYHIPYAGGEYVLGVYFY